MTYSYHLRKEDIYTSRTGQQIRDKGSLKTLSDKCGTPLPLSPTPCSLGWSSLPAKERAFPGLSFLICKMARSPVSPSSLGGLGPPQPLSLSNPRHVYSAPVVQKGKGPSSESWQAECHRFTVGPHPPATGTSSRPFATGP